MALLNEMDNPYNKLLSRGKSALTDAEIIAILLRTGTQELSNVDIANRMLGHVNHDLYSLSKLCYDDLLKIKGIGKSKALTIIAAFELGMRKRAQQSITKKLKSSRESFEILYPYFDMNYEQFYVISLSRANTILSIDKIGEGGFNACWVDNKKIFYIALNKKASNIIVAHNHPSGQVMASDKDIKLTEKLKNACKFMEITLLDHLIIGNEIYYSFADEGMLL